MTNPEQKIMVCIECKTTMCHQSCRNWNHGERCTKDCWHWEAVRMEKEAKEMRDRELKAYKTSLLQSLLKRGPKDLISDDSWVFGRNKANQEWRNLINLMINECK